MKKIFIASFIAMLLSGCETVNHNKYITQSHIQKKNIADDESGYYPSYNSIVKLCEPANAANKVCDVPSDLLGEFLKEGLLLTKANCLATLEDINQGSKNSRWLKDEFLIGTVLATGLMSLNGASSNSIEKLALWSSFLVSSSELYNNYYLLGPDSKSVISLVERALQEQEKYALSTRPTSFTSAAKEVLNYSIVCSSSKIDELVQQSMEKADFKAPERESYFQDLSENIRKVLGAPKLNSKQISAIYYIVEMQDQKYVQSNFYKDINVLIGAFEDEINKSAQELISIFSSYPLNVQDALKSNATYWVKVNEILPKIESFKSKVNSKVNDKANKDSLYDAFGNFTYVDKAKLDFKAFLNTTSLSNAEKTALENELKALDDEVLDELFTKNLKYEPLLLPYKSSGSEIVKIE